MMVGLNLAPGEPESAYAWTRLAIALLLATLGGVGLDADAYDFTKVRSGRKLWNFSTKEPELWTSAL